MHPFSVAIIQYLCNRYDLPEHWYPRKDIKAQAKVNEYLNWQHANTRMNCAMVFRHLVSRPVKSSMWNHQGSLWLIYCGFCGCPCPWNSILNKLIWWNRSFLHYTTKCMLLCSQETFIKIYNLRKLPPPKKKKDKSPNVSMVAEEQTVTDNMMLMKFKK